MVKAKIFHFSKIFICRKARYKKLMKTHRVWPSSNWTNLVTWIVCLYTYEVEGEYCRLLYCRRCVQHCDAFFFTYEKSNSFLLAQLVGNIISEFFAFPLKTHQPKSSRAKNNAPKPYNNTTHWQGDEQPTNEAEVHSCISPSKWTRYFGFGQCST